ncbi:MAG: D-aminoacyl-tRNA deacylase [Acidimicrobiia bacterium]
MRIVLQRVSSATVRVEGSAVGSIGRGLCLLIGVADADGEAEIEAAAEKIAGLRVFADGEGRMNLPLREVGGEVLAVSQFTLLADVRKGRRPSFTSAASPDRAQPLIESLVEELRGRGITVAEGVFGASMEVELVNEGPVTLVLDIEEGTVR